MICQAAAEVRHPRCRPNHASFWCNSRLRLLWRVTNNRCLGIVCGVVFSVGFLRPEWVLAAGFAITAQGAAASGKSGAFTAQADDPSALYYNPAGISQLERTQVLAGVSTIVPRIAYHPDATGPRSDQENQTFFIPHLYLTHELTPQFTAGIGAFTPFGLATDWPVDWEGRFQVTYASIRASVVRAAVSWRPTKSVSVAGGPDFALVRVEQRRRINLSQVGETVGIGPLAGNPEGSVELNGDATAVGFHGALLLRPVNIVRLGLNFRSRLHAKIDDGRVTFDVPVPAFQSAFPDGNARTEVTLPPLLGAGIWVELLRNWTVEFDATWTGWSTIDRLTVEFDQGLPVPSETTDFSWDDTMTYSVGTEYRINAMVFRGGYTFDFTPIPDETVGPVIADGNRQFFTFGVGVERALWSASVGYQLLLFERAKRNDTGAAYSSVGSLPTIPPIDARANGLYESYSHTFVIGFLKRF